VAHKQAERKSSKSHEIDIRHGGKAAKPSDLHTTIVRVLETWGAEWMFWLSVTEKWGNIVVSIKCGQIKSQENKPIENWFSLEGKRVPRNRDGQYNGHKTGA